MIRAALAGQIRSAGPISVAEYMDAVAKAYYARAEVFGPAGDFVTAPEISQVFGELIGLWCAVVWRNMGAPASFRLVECGPGRGTLMNDLLRAAARGPGFTAAAEIHLVERSPALRAKQRDLLKNQGASWHDDLSAVPRGPLILVANEFLDALPVRQFEMTAAGWMERYVGLDQAGSFIFVLQPGSPEPAPPAKIGAVFEMSPAMTGFASQVAARLSRDGGAALLIDYGHEATAVGETLQAVKKHKPCGVFETPGEADLTAHVDFSAVAKAARTEGAAVFGPLGQGVWLDRLGIKLRGLQLAKAKAPEIAEAIESSVRRLVAPDAMGALFKVMAISHPSLATPDGFQQDAGR
ncbi:MAG: class I SAM-dependent methyltransferase [Rhodospirillaceae bacterium]|nr:class I SAM-dependent methyltransferase [Rhodospirillaceae bacterium]